MQHSVRKKKANPLAPPLPAARADAPTPTPAPLGATATAAIPRTISIKAARHAAVPERPAEQPSAPSPTAQSPAAHFSAEALLAAWEAYANSIRTARPSIYSLMGAIRPEPTEGFALRIPVESPMQQELLKTEAQALLSHLKQALGNTQLSFQFELAAHSQGAHPHRAYTSSDKLKDMVSRNPLLAKLQEQLDLLIE